MSGAGLGGPVHATLAAWLREGRRVVACALVEAIGSAPLDPGALLLVDADEHIEGTVTGGCVEGALVEEARAVLAGGPARLVSYGVSDEAAIGVGLSCGGTVRVLVHEIAGDDRDSTLFALDAAAAGRRAALATLLDGPLAGAQLAVDADRTVGSLHAGELLDDGVARDARGLLDAGGSGIRRYGADGETAGDELSVAVTCFTTPPQLVVCGATDFSAAACAIGRQLGYRATIVDARSAFAASRRYSDVADVVVTAPHRHLETLALGPRDLVLVFSHDPKFDEPALEAALRSGAGYVGALGSRQTQHDRFERLRERGLSDGELARVHAPCGLDLGARTPAETAISILAEALAMRTGREARPLGETGEPIHPARDHPWSVAAPEGRPG